ncbi:MAG: DUF4126 domain-containing protein [Leptolyngbya sp. SIOISBB]|nr:DUF4126 domain-containing protein [Leptolyngbya sp. SIOISBB]
MSAAPILYSVQRQVGLLSPEDASRDPVPFKTLQAPMAILESIGIGLGLGTAAGFRTLVPFVVLSMVPLFGHVLLSDNLAWLGTYPAFITLAIALTIEMLTYSISWLDKALDTIALPIAAMAGTVLMALAVNQYDPVLQWSLAIIAGGGTAATTRGLSSLTRLIATVSIGACQILLWRSLSWSVQSVCQSWP